MRKHIKRFTALLLGGLLAFNSLTVYADGDLNGTGQGQENQGGEFSYSGGYHIYHVNQGIRAYIMNKDGTVVSNVVDFVRYRPQDFAAGSGFSAEQFDYMVKTYQNKIGRWDKNKNADLNTDKSFGGKQTMVYLGGGKKDVSYVVTYDNLMNPQTGVQHPVRKSYDRNDSDFYTTSLVSAKMYTYAEVERYLKNYIESRYGAGSSPIDPAGGTAVVDTLTKQGVTISKKFKDPLNFEGWGSGLVASGEELKDQMTTVFKQDGAIMLQLLSMMAMPVRDGKGDLVPEKGLEPLFTFYDKSLNDKVAALKASGSENPLFDLFGQEKLYLAFEPIHWASFEVMKPNAKEGYNGNMDEAFYSTPYIMYGTPSQIMWQCAKMLREYVAVNTGFFGMEMPPKYDNESLPEFLNWLEKEGFYCNWEWGLSDRIYMLDKDEPSLGLVKHSNIVDDMTPSYWRQLVDGYYGTGYGIMLFSLNPETGTSTFDELNYSSSSTNGFRPGPSEDKSNEGGLESKNRIVKYYANKLSNEYIYTENHTRENTVSQVTLENEEGYKVDSWFTSSEFKQPVSDTDSYDDCKNSIPNKQTGVSTGLVQLEKEDTLYLRLVKQPEVTKIYESNGATDKVVVDNNPQFENGSLIVTTPDEGYNYVEGVESPENADPDSWQDVPAAGNSTTDTRIPVKDTTKEIFIHYQKPDVAATGLVLHENEISHQFGLSDVTGSLVEGVQNWSSVSSDASCPEIWYCGGCSGEDDEDCNGHRCGASYDYTGSEDWSFGIENKPNYNTQFVYKWVQLEPKSWTGGGLSESGGSGKGTPNMNMILQRTINDKVTLYPSKNSNKAALNDMGITSEGYKPANTRKDGLKDVPSRKSWTETFNTNFEFVNVNEPTAYFESDHGYTDEDTHTDSGNNKGTLNGAYSKSGNTKVYGLWGKENKGDKALTDTAQQNIWKLSTLNFKGFKNHIKEQEFTFYPYYKMKFISELDGSEQDAYLTAENLSTLLSLQRVDTSIFRPKGATTLELTSSQWSTHAKAHNLLADAGVDNKNSLLPAGAIYDLRTAGNGVKASQSWIGYRVFNSYVMDKNALADASAVKTKQEVVDAVNAFKTDTKNVLSNYEVVMVGQEGINPDDNNGEFYRGSEVITGKDGSYRLGQEFIRDSKYDLQTTGSASGNSSDIDVLEELEETYDWVLTSDADGNVVITRNGVEFERLQKNQKNLTNAEVKEFDSRTNIVTNFLSAIDRNMGSDRNGKTWYNEGFSVGCLETRLAYRMGFGDGDASLRSTALNIKANGKLDNRNDMFNGDEAKNRSYQFFTSARSTLNGCEKDYVGTYDGIKIFIPNMNQLLVSNRFYTSNTTVMDLN